MEKDCMTFTIEFRKNLTNIIYFLSLNFFINRRYGNGCQANLYYLVNHKTNTLFDLRFFFNQNFSNLYFYKTFLIGFGSFWNYATSISSLFYFTVIIGTISLVLIIALLLFTRMKNKNVNTQKIILDETFIDLTKIKNLY
jgi:hypothetical protein